VYAFNPSSGAVSVLAEHFAMCNGIAFSPDFKTLYVTDTGEESVSGAQLPLHLLMTSRLLPA
jgi:gluconolactonase